MLVAFHYSDKIPETKNLKGQKIYFGSQFQSFHSVVCWLCCFWTVVRQNTVVKGHGREKLLTSWQPGRETGKVKEQDTPFKGIPPVTYFLQSGPAF
jgi:hypothetical protein